MLEFEGVIRRLRNAFAKTDKTAVGRCEKSPARIKNKCDALHESYLRMNRFNHSSIGEVCQGANVRIDVFLVEFTISPA